MNELLSMLDLARDLAEIAGETSDPVTAARLLALADEVLVAGGYLPKAADNTDCPKG